VGKDKPLTGTAKWQLRVTVDDLERAEDAELHPPILMRGHPLQTSCNPAAAVSQDGPTTFWLRATKRTQSREVAMSSTRIRWAARRIFRPTSIAAGAILALTVAGTGLAGLVSGTLPTAAFTFTSTTVNDVNMDGNGTHLKTKGSINVKTTYTKLAPTGALTGWHYHNGPVIVTVAVGTITYVGADCQTWDLSAGHSYIESTGEILNAYMDPAKNTGLDYVEWFTTRLYPAGMSDPVAVAAPC
jgi:hypothetical protein